MYSMLNRPPGGWREPTPEEMSGASGVILNAGGCLFGVLGFGAVAIVLGPLVGAFLLAHPDISAKTLWAVVKALSEGTDATEAAVKAGGNAAAVAAITDWIEAIPGLRELADST